MYKKKIAVGLSGGLPLPRLRKDKGGKKVAIGLSGGVDSSLSAALLVERGYEVTGVFLECWREPGCRTDEDRKDALRVALKLKIPFKVLDFKKEYKHKVVDYFYSEYKAGRTPNPDVMCNKEIKFGMFYDWALRPKGPQGELLRVPQGKPRFDFVATGHYARIGERTKNKKLKMKNYSLLRGKDVKKDQSYFLYRLRQDQLGQILFPIGEMTKSQVRREAKKRGLHTAGKPDSQGICFIGPVNIREFLREKLPEKKGEVVDTRGNVVGSHDGVWFYTIGQRHGFRLNPRFPESLATGQAEIRSTKQTAIPPLYVVKKDVKKNQLMVGFGAETYRTQFNVSEINWVAELTNNQFSNNQRRNRIKVRIRHGGNLIDSRLMIHDSAVKVKLDEPQRGVAPGQSAVFYRGKECIGGGVIQ